MTRDVHTLPIGLDIPALAPQEGEVNADVAKAEEDAADMFVAKPEEQSVNEVDYVPSDVHAVPMGLNNLASVNPEEEVNTVVINMDSDAPIMTTQTDNVNNNVVGAATDITAITIAELECPHANCQFVTGAVQDCVQYGMEMYAAKYAE